MSFPLISDGFIQQYLFTGRKESEFSCDVQETNQLRSEKLMRAAATHHAPLTPPTEEEIHLGGQSPLGLPWKYYYSHDNIFVDDAAFYEELCRLEMHAVTELVAEAPVRVTARLWSYAAVDVWQDGALVCTLERPVYKPIQAKDFTLELKAGRNLIYVRSETLGVRDTRIAFGIQIIDGTDKVRVELPDAADCAPYTAASALLDSARIRNGLLELDAPLPAGSRLRYNRNVHDFYKRDEQFLYEDVAGQSRIALKDFVSFALEIPVGDTVLCRYLERAELRKPAWISPDAGDPRRYLLEKMAEIRSEPRSATDGFSLFTMLARKYLGQNPAFDHEEIKITLNQIERRMDCADFMTTALIRLKREYGIPADLEAEVKRVMLNFRYWMDEPGQDGMCFWSENHTLMFFQTAYFFGQDYPDDIFVRSGKTGRELREMARMRIREWMTDVCENGFDEFNSSVYTPLTLAAMLNIVDYAEPELAELATKACDLLIRTAVRHCFKGILVSPMGRVYRGIIAPWAEGMQCLINYLFPETPYSINPCLSFLATTHYQIPTDLRQIMEETGAYSYTSSNARIDLYKTPDYVLTSVQSPRRDGVQRVWQANESEEIRDHFIYVKSLNEHFHGTTEFQPGEYGYQQHMWYAALDTDLVVFGNHPGQTCEDMSEVRPGYWFGNGIMPALRQENNLLGMVYDITESYPIHFTHLFWQQDRFDETAAQGGWLFGRRGDSYIGVWCSSPLVDHSETMFGCEKRAYASRCAYLVTCGSKGENGSFADFCAGCAARQVSFDADAVTLHCAEFDLPFVAGQNNTQILD